MALLGYQGYLYVARNHATTDTDFEVLDGIAPAGTKNFQNVTKWRDIEEIVDVDSPSDQETVDVTNRRIARTGKKAELVVTSSGTITFGYQSNQLSAAANDMLRILTKAAVDKVLVTLLDLNGPWADNVANKGYFGTVANYKLSFNTTRPLAGVQLITFTASLDDYLSHVEVDNAATGELKLLGT
jgi:hypothetical protein